MGQCHRKWKFSTKNWTKVIFFCGKFHREAEINFAYKIPADLETGFFPNCWLLQDKSNCLARGYELSGVWCPEEKMNLRGQLTSASVCSSVCLFFPHSPRFPLEYSSPWKYFQVAKLQLSSSLYFTTGQSLKSFASACILAATTNTCPPLVPSGVLIPLSRKKW